MKTSFMALRRTSPRYPGTMRRMFHGRTGRAGHKAPEPFSWQRPVPARHIRQPKKNVSPPLPRPASLDENLRGWTLYPAAPPPRAAPAAMASETRPKTCD
ncbi:hypothetical protein NDU88_000476 [Pleurodeles waltl]|uniref:Uncharacterized protein n=1 Tax=Pleurodeles waltl TaxID=8319 RepID=A0AAV7MPV6_PLEWA|nr:hypothetical protein NDU88_000476 [Pleurodeles waltl]